MAAFPWDAVIGAAGSVLGSVLGGKGTSAKKQAKLAWKNQEKAWLRGPQLMVEGAQRAGLHPLTVLGSNFSAPGVQVVDGQSGWGDAIGSALQAGAQGVADWRARKMMEDQQQEQRFQALLDNIERGKLNESTIAVNNAQINALNAQAVDSLASADRSRTMIANARNQAIGAAPVTSTLEVPFTGGGLPVKSPGLAQKAQDNYGDIVENVWGLGALTRDLLNMGAGWMVKQHRITQDMKRRGVRRPVPKWRP